MQDFKKIKLTDASRLLNLKGEFTLTDIKANHLEMIKRYHPDRVGDVGAKWAALVNAARDLLVENLGKYHNTGEAKGQQYGTELADAIDKLFDIDGLEDIEIKGSWLWVWNTDDTRNTEIKEAGLRPCKGIKEGWWYKNPCADKGQKRSRGRGRTSMEKINATHGSTRVTRPNRQRIGA